MVDKKILNTHSKDLSPSIRIGKNGLTDSIYTEIESQLKRKAMIKIKLLSNAFDRESKKEIFNQISKKAESSGYQVISTVGSTIVLYNPRKKLV